MNRFEGLPRQLLRLAYRTLSAYRRLVALALFISAALVLIYKLRTKGIPVYVVEEHHEALVYWWEGATYNGLISSQGNTLIHIDAHPDDSTPTYISGMPRFQFPTSDWELSLFLQRNDVFIQGAVMSGLVSHMIWIWPSWDEDLVNNRGSYEANNVQLGWYTPSLPNGADSRGAAAVESEMLCQCIVPIVVISHETPPVRCSYVNDTETDASKRDVDIRRSECHVVTSYLFESISDVAVLERLKDKPKWLDDSSILDVDEDFFGCENPAKLLVGDDISWQVIESIDSKLREFLCPRHVEHERTGNSFMKDLVRGLRDACRYDETEGRCRTSFIEAFELTDEILLKEFLMGPSLFCSKNDAHLRSKWYHLARTLYDLPLDHIERILDVGFCLGRTPKSLPYLNDLNEAIPMSLQVCHGLNEPESDIVFLHTPTAAEVAKHMQVFQTIVSHIPKPKLVTLCRSVRDGYTPRNLSRFIESGILNAFDESIKAGIDILYDDDLLGGELGWMQWQTY